MNVKIECDCGQHYAFDIEPVNGLMSSTVACPICGADGTTAANQIIAGKIPAVLSPSASPAFAPARSESGADTEVASSGYHTPTLPSNVKVDARTLGLVDRETAETEARAKISWGDSQDEVIKYLMLQGFSAPEASEVVAVMFKERLAALRVKGTKKMIQGFAMMCVPVVGFFANMTMISYRLMALMLLIGAVGFWFFFNGLFMVVAPKMETGDVAE